VESRCLGAFSDGLRAGRLGFDSRQCNISVLPYFYEIGKSKAIPITFLGGLYGSEMLRILHYLDIRLTDVSKVVSPTHRQRSAPQKHYFCLWYSFLLEAE
jgi:hypothetical protein